MLTSDFGADLERILANALPWGGLSRRDRVAMEGALENLRLWCTRRPTEEDADTALVDALDALDLIGTDRPQFLGGAIPRERRKRGHIIGSTRVLRARLALVLRAVLRMEAGEGSCVWPREAAFGPLWTCDCASRGAVGPKGIPACEPCSWCGALPPAGAACIRPLWEDAPPHEGRTPRERREARRC